MNTVEKIKAELKAQKIPVSRMERELGFANGYLGQLKKGTMPVGRLQAVADYLGKPLMFFIPDGAIKTWDELTEEQQREIKLTEQRREEAKQEYTEEADGLIKDLQILRDRPDLRALLYVGMKNTPEQVYRLAKLMESMNGEEQ